MKKSTLLVAVLLGVMLVMANSNIALAGRKRDRDENKLRNKNIHGEFKDTQAGRIARCAFMGKYRGISCWHD